MTRSSRMPAVFATHSTSSRARYDRFLISVTTTPLPSAFPINPTMRIIMSTTIPSGINKNGTYVLKKVK